MGAELFVRVEGVNLGNFIEDVHDLSTIRGGSFLLLEAVDRVQQHFHLEAISTGASSGFFAGPDGDAEKLRTDVEAFLGSDEQLRHATFVVDVVRGDFASARESLIALNRWRQFQQPTVAIPSRGQTPGARACALDHVRPASKTIVTGDGKHKEVSASVNVRRQFGRDRKQSFYARELKKLKDANLDGLIEQVERSEFVADIEALAADPDRKSLDGKIAVVYFDGNRFGEIQKNCRNRADLSRFDQTLKGYRQRALAALLQLVFDDRSGWVTKAGEIRLETLLWGGDEVLWVVPAWKGWELLSLFYEVSASWKFGGPLTHAGGVVFCHRSAPIHRMTKIAKELAQSAKDEIVAGAPNTHAARDLFAYQVLESFDEIGPDFAKFREKRALTDTTADLVLHGGGLRDVVTYMDVLRKQFARSKLHEIVLALRDKREHTSALIETTVSELSAEGRKALDDLFRFFGAETVGRSSDAAAKWLHIVELWDYAIQG